MLNASFFGLCKIKKLKYVCIAGMLTCYKLTNCTMGLMTTWSRISILINFKLQDKFKSYTLNILDNINCWWTKMPMKLRFFEKATKSKKIPSWFWHLLGNVKTKSEILLYFVALLEYLNLQLQKCFEIIVTWEMKRVFLFPLYDFA